MSAMDLEPTSSFTPGISREVLRAAAEDEKREQAEAARLITLDELEENFSLFSWGYSDPLKVTKNGKTEYIRVRIKSVGIAELMESYQAKMPSPPAMQKLMKKDSPEAKELGYKHDIMLMVVNQADPKYLEDQRKHDNEAGQEIVLRGWGHDLKWNGALVLKGSDMSSPNEVIDRDGALKAFKRLGLTAEHFSILVRNIRELTAEAEKSETKN